MSSGKQKVMTGKQMMVVFTRYFGLIWVAGLCYGCFAKDHWVSRPIIAANPDWQMVESCGYQGCLPMVDFLSSKNIRIRIDVLDYQRVKELTITIRFMGKDFGALKSPLLDEYTFEPSAVTVQLKNGMVLKPNGFKCSYAKEDQQLIEGAMPLTRNDCFRLVFDYPPPSVEEEFTMNLGILKRLGQPVSIPTVYFRKAISRW